MLLFLAFKTREDKREASEEHGKAATACRPASKLSGRAISDRSFGSSRNSPREFKGLKLIWNETKKSYPA